MSTFAIIAVATAALISVAPQVSASPILDAFNPTATGNGGTYNADDIGWFYTPAFSYTLDGIGAKFTTPIDGRMVTALIFSGMPGSLTELGEGGFTPVANSFADAAITPILLTAGTTYFVALENVAGLGSNLVIGAQDPFPLISGSDVSFWYIDYGDKSFSDLQTQGGVGPIVEFSGVPVPEPGSFAMLPLV
jgi:hypothetical protein